MSEENERASILNSRSEGDDKPWNRIEIGEVTIGAGHPSFIIAEIAQAHDGSLGTAHAYIDAVAESGANAVKFQTHIAAAESTTAESFRVKGFPQDKSRFEYWKRMEFTHAQWRGLAAHAEEKKIVFLSTPFSMEAVDLLQEVGMVAWKIGSGDTNNLPLLERVASTGAPVLLSTGMSSWSEIDEAVKTIRNVGGSVAVFQCTTAYPCPPQKVGLNVVRELRERFDCPVGLSDHSGTIFPGLAAVTLGANLVEVHTVFSRECFGPDVRSSVTTSELKQLVQGIRFIESALETPISKDTQSDQLKDLKVLFGRSLYARRDLPQGTVLSPEDIALKKPGTGIPSKRLQEVLGRRLSRAYNVDEPIEEVDLD